jgi:hypothetical protein
LNATSNKRHGSVIFAILLASCVQSPPPQQTAPALSQNAGQEAIARELLGCGQEERIRLTAESAEDARGAVLIFRLANVSTETLTAYPFQLPWGNPNSIEVAAATVHGAAATTFFPISDPIAETKVSLAPGNVLMGRFELANRIQGLRELQRSDDILVSWSYRSPFSPSRRCVSGIAVLPRRPN